MAKRPPSLGPRVPKTGAKKPLSKFHEEIRMTFGQKLKSARESAGYEHASDFAKVLGLEENRYRHYERGSAEPSFEILCKMCQMLDLEPNDLLPQGKRRRRRDLSSPPSRAAS